LAETSQLQYLDNQIEILRELMKYEDHEVDPLEFYFKEINKQLTHEESRLKFLKILEMFQEISKSNEDANKFWEELEKVNVTASKNILAGKPVPDLFQLENDFKKKVFSFEVELKKKSDEVEKIQKSFEQSESEKKVIESNWELISTETRRIVKETT
jgi:hypothetical protein